MTHPIFQVDAFTDHPFTGNPAAVCLLAEPAVDNWMQHVAAEMNLSETAFVCPEQDVFNLRWFTPTLEVDLCGHATLASAHVMWEVGRAGLDDPIRFVTRSGMLTVSREAGWMQMDFPALPPESAPPPPGLLEALGVEAVYVGRSRFDYLVEVASEAEVLALQPDFQKMRSIAGRGVMVTSPASRTTADFVSRFFAPGAGIDEDPVTGSAHCCLGPHWGERLGKTELVGYQASRRGGTVRVNLLGERVLLGGQAVTILRGELGC